jgi:phenylacetic acid degradation operon negative regulatory protein
MSNIRNGDWGPGRRPSRPLTARSVVASLLLGVTPPRLPSRHLVHAGRLFGIEEGTIRVALSRMVAAGELHADDGTYELAGKLLDRQARQTQSRSPATVAAWSGDWVMAAVPAGRRDASSRAELRAATEALRLAELREGLWLRPDNLAPARLPDAEHLVREQCVLFAARPDDPRELTATLWDLGPWASEAAGLRVDMDRFSGRLEAGDTDALSDAFLVAAAVLRHLVADPLLPPDLLDPGWPGPSLREEYERYESAFKSLWREAIPRT